MKKTPGDIIILQLCTTNDNHDVWLLRYLAQQTEFLTFWAIFCPLSPKNPENQNFDKMKKLPGDIIILHKCNLDDNHIDVLFLRYEAQQTEFFCHFGLFFVLLSPPPPPPP